MYMCNSVFDFKLNQLKKEFSGLDYRLLSSKILLTFCSVTVFLVLKWKAGFFLYCKYTHMTFSPELCTCDGECQQLHWLDTSIQIHTQLHTWWKSSFLFNRCICLCVCVWPVNTLAWFPQAWMFYLLSFPEIKNVAPFYVLSIDFIA